MCFLVWIGLFGQHATAEDGLVLMVSNGITFTLLLIANYLLQIRQWLPMPPLPVSLIILMTIFTLVASLLARYRIRLLTAIASRFLSWRSAKGGFGERVLIVGAGEGGQVVNWLLRRGALRQAFKVIGMVDDDPAKQGMRIDGCRVLGGTREIPEIVSNTDVGVILFTITNLSNEARNTLLKFCDIPNVRLVMVNDVLRAFQNQLAGESELGNLRIWIGIIRLVLVTGAGGFIGSHLVESLLTAGARVRAFVRYNSRGDPGLLRMCPPELAEKLEVIPGDLRDGQAIQEAVHGLQLRFSPRGVDLNPLFLSSSS